LRWELRKRTGNLFAMLWIIGRKQKRWRRKEEAV
jgi:hypothetical protein